MNLTNSSMSENCLDMEKHDSKSCVPQEAEIIDVKLARAYVPFQKYCFTYIPMDSLINGTTFPELNMPYFKGHYHCHCHCQDEKPC